MSDAVIWHFDPVSPFAYLALPEVERVALTRPVTFNPVVFGAVLSQWGQLGPAEIAPKRVHTYRLCQFLAERAGVRFRFPPLHPFRSLDALRLMVAAGATGAAVRTVFEFIWAEGRDPVAERGALAARLGFADADAAIAASGAKERLRLATEAAIGAGVFGVPTLQVGRELFWGWDAMGLAEAYLADAGVLEAAEMRRVSTLGVGVERQAPAVPRPGAPPAAVT